MDIICPKCSEPMDLDELHYMGVPFDEARRIFFEKGCNWLYNGKECAPTYGDNEVGEKSAVLYELLGDDIDGIASMLEDFA